MSDRFPDATLALELLPAPAVIKTLDYEATRAARLADLVARLRAAGIDYDVAVAPASPETITTSEADPGVILQEEGAYREIYNLQEINDAAKAVMILYARGTDQDVLYALLGIRRLVLVPANPAANPPTSAVMEDDDSFLARAQLALEGTAPGLTGGGYASVALRASADVRRVSLQRAPGGVVNVILQGRSNGQGTTIVTPLPGGTTIYAWTADTTTPNNDGTVSDAAVQAVAAALNDDWSNDPSTGSQLTDIPQVRSATAKPYDVVVRAIVPPGPTAAAVGAQALAALIAVAQSLQLVGTIVPTDALIAAGRLAPMTKFYLDSPAADVVAAADEVPFGHTITLTLIVQ